MPPEAFIAYESPGRFRVRIPSLKGNAALAVCGEKSAACPGVGSVAANPETGSLLFLHETTSDVIIEYARAQGIFLVKESGSGRSAPPVNFRKALRAFFGKADLTITKATNGSLDLSSVAIVGLLGAGAVQILEGTAGALPWFAAFWYAFNLAAKETE